jgi:biotin carboxylase
MSQNIFVIGLDEFNLRMLETVRGAGDYAFHGLVPYDEIVNPAHYPMEKLLGDARCELERFGGSVDAIIGHWDFPTTCMLPILRRELGLPTASLESVLACENKYWSRLEQEQAIPEATPRFAGVDPFDDRALERIELEYPFWLKPVIAFSSYLGFRIENEDDFRQAIERIRPNIGKFAEPFDHFLEYAQVPEGMPDTGGGYCIAEELISGHLCTLEGYVYQGQPRIYGLIDSIRGPNDVSFARYQMPARNIPDRVRARMEEYAARVIRRIGLDHHLFNIEFFWHEERDEIRLLEINSRLSKSHSPIFYMVSGASHHEVAIDVALGREPDFPRQEGRFRVAAKFMPRTYQDARVTRAPTLEDIGRVQERFPETLVNVLVEDGSRLSDLPNQDSYSFEIGEVFMGADSQEELLESFREAMQILDFRFSEEVETNYDG